MARTLIMKESDIMGVLEAPSPRRQPSVAHLTFYQFLLRAFIERQMQSHLAS